LASFNLGLTPHTLLPPPQFQFGCPNSLLFAHCFLAVILVQLCKVRS
jgi:hypothetical protein